MKISDIERFFRELDRRIDFPVKVTLTGGAAAIVMGVKRATQDIDFEVELSVAPSKRAVKMEALQNALTSVSAATRITPQFSEDIDRWSSIAMPVRKSRKWLKIGKVEVRVLAPGLWALGKLSRYLSTDEGDLVTVFAILKPPPLPLARLWGRALGGSPSSSAQPLFSKHVEVFLRKNGPSIWGEEIQL